MSKLAIILCAVFFTSVANACDDLAKSRHNATDDIDHMTSTLDENFNKIISLAAVTEKFVADTVETRIDVFSNGIDKTFQEAKDALSVLGEDASSGNRCNRFLNELKEEHSLEKTVVMDCGTKVLEESTEFIANLTGIKKSTEETLNKLRTDLYRCGGDLNADRLNSPATPDDVECFNGLVAEAASLLKERLAYLNDLLSAQTFVFERLQLESMINGCIKDSRYRKFLSNASNLMKNTKECARQEMNNSIQ